MVLFMMKVAMDTSVRQKTTTTSKPKRFARDTHSQHDTRHARAHTKHATKSLTHLTPTAKQTRPQKQQKAHPHGRRKQHINKTRKWRKQNRQLKQSTKTKKINSQTKHNKLTPKFAMLPIRPAITARASEKAKKQVMRASTPNW